MRFNRRNWIRFFDGHNKSTTIRLRRQRVGHHNVWAGSYYHPELLGTLEVIGVKSKLFKELNMFDAKMDGFSTLDELKTELLKLNKSIELDNLVYINHVENPINKYKVESKGE